jgi:hypothetical protein
MLFQSSDIDPPKSFSLPGNFAGSCTAGSADFFAAFTIM